MAVKTGEQRLKEMEAEMALFEQEVLGAPVTVPTVTPMVEAVPVALAVPTVSVIRPIIATNTYQQVQQSLDARAAAAATVVTPIIPPPATFVGPVVPSPRPAPILRPTFVPHVLQRPGPRPPPMRPPAPMVAPPIPGPPPMMMGPPMSGPPAPPMAPIGRMGPIPPGVPVTPMVSVPRPMIQAAPKLNPTVIQAAPTVYSAPPVKKHEARIQEEVQEQLLIPEEKDVSVLDDTIIGPSMPELEAVHLEQVMEVGGEDKKKNKPEKVKRCIRTAAGTSWEDPSLLEWDSDDFRIFCGDLGNEVNDDILARAFSRYPSFLKAKVIRDKRTGKTKGYGFVSFKDPNDYVRAMREMNGKYVGSRPIKLRKSMWKDRNIEVVRKKQKEKKKLGLR
ncbi:RNA-binding protein 42 isoform X2 [Latimeria chalumnae]|uniref:RNA-binding protein 42 isoform X2 n=1 Tax=Latimeria chalumnae TaxID=7897 RepID=UPI0006D93391|nr:PREDICTED: RNA-binding protein 42 [Latimeria chalumnae]|eukprot:XP_014339264.1 PREDICTED: RNA-binding protein 42 [Latimeria chalumnae]